MRGVSQGTILDTISLLIYITCLLNLNLNYKIVSYADNSVIFVTDKNTDSLYSNANRVRNNVKDWFDNNRLELNFNKSK